MGTGTAGRLDRMAEGLDIEAMLQRFKDRAVAVKNRNLPPVAGPEPTREQAARIRPAMRIADARVGDVIPRLTAKRAWQFQWAAC